MAEQRQREDLSGLSDPCTVEQLARAMRMSKNSIHEEIRAGHLRARRWGKTIRIRREAIDEWLRPTAIPA